MNEFYQKKTYVLRKRTVEPIDLMFYAFSWHLTAWCQLRSQYQDFNLIRIICLNAVNEPFQKMKQMPLIDYMNMLSVNF